MTSLGYRVLVCFAAWAVLNAAPTRADERLKGIACRSVHLQYSADEGGAFFNEIRVEKSAPGTYFAVCGWDKGYYGIQELGNGKKLLIFSVWDSGQNDPNAVREDRRVKLIYKDKQVRTGRFGGEGTGGQSFLDFDWKVGRTYRFLVTARANDRRTEYAAYFFLPAEKEWKHLVTFSTITGGRLLRGYYSFVEDFKRDRASATKARAAQFGNGWVMTKAGSWVALSSARFTADSNPVMSINAAVVNDRFLLATGGGTKNTGARLGMSMDLPAGKRTPPDDLPRRESTEKK
jgi:hypothetical protein